MIAHLKAMQIALEQGAKMADYSMSRHIRTLDGESLNVTLSPGDPLIDVAYTATGLLKEIIFRIHSLEIAVNRLNNDQSTRNNQPPVYTAESSDNHPAKNTSYILKI